MQPNFFIRGNGVNGSNARGLSHNLWYDCPQQAFTTGWTGGVFIDDDFESFPHITTPTITTVAAINGKLGYKAFGSSGATILPVASKFDGECQFVTAATDDHQVSMQTIQTPFRVSKLVGKFWGEARLKLGSIADTHDVMYFGMSESLTMTVIIPIVAAGGLSDHNHFGFLRTETASQGAQLDTTYKANGVTAVVVKNNCLDTSLNLTGTGTALLVADTYMKLGFKFHPKDPFNNNKATLAFYVNGLRLPDVKEIPDNTGTDFPADVWMAPVIATKNAAANASTNTLDRWTFCQEDV